MRPHFAQDDAIDPQKMPQPKLPGVLIPAPCCQRYVGVTFLDRRNIFWFLAISLFYFTFLTLLTFIAKNPYFE